MTDFSPFAVLIVVLLAAGFLLRPVLRMVLPEGGWGKKPRGEEARSRKAAGLASLETGAFVGVLAGLLAAWPDVPVALLFVFGIGFAAGLLLLPEFVRPPLGVATAVVSVLRLEPTAILVVLVVGAGFFGVRSLTSHLFQR